jgi:hypothetical protein
MRMRRYDSETSRNDVQDSSCKVFHQIRFSEHRGTRTCDRCCLEG